MSGAGRPRGESPARRKRASEFLAMHQRGMSVPSIAACVGLSASFVFEEISKARQEEAPYGDPSGSARTPPKPRRLTERMLLHRAWIAMHLDGRLRGLDRDTRLLWLDIAVAIGKIGDGFSLHFTDSGFEDRADFAASYQAQDAQLTKLVRRRLLTDEGEGAGIGLPRDLGLTPKERLGGSLLPSSREMRTRVPAQGYMLHVVPRGENDSGETPPLSGLDSGKTPILPESDSGETPPLFGLDSGKTPISPESGSRGFLTDDDDKNQENQSSKVIIVSPPPGTQAGAGATQTGVLAESDGNKSGVSQISDSTNINSKRTAQEAASGALAAELLALGKLQRPPRSRELGRIQTWLEKGLAPDTIRAVAATVFGRVGGDPPVSLLYLDQEMGMALAQAQTSATPPPAAAAPAAPISPVELALRAELQPSRDAWMADKSCPFPPSLTTFIAATEAGRANLAERWLPLFAAWDRARRPGGCKPPDFTLLASDWRAFGHQLDECEERLTAPGSATA